VLALGPPRRVARHLTRSTSRRYTFSELHKLTSAPCGPPIRGPNDPQPTPDVRLVERMAAGDRDAHEEFCERHRLSLYAQAYALLIDATAAERVVVEALERAWQAARTSIRRRERVRLAVGDGPGLWRNFDAVRPGAHGVAFSSALGRRPPRRGRRAVYSASHVHPSCSAADRWATGCRAGLGLWSAVAVLVGSTIGGGIFRTPAIIAERVPAPLPMFGVWILGACSRCAARSRTPSWPRCSPARRRVRLHPGRVRAAAGVSVRLDGAGC